MKKNRIGIVLINWAIGGSEKRFANLFNYLIENSNNNYTLIINEFLKTKLDEIGLLTHNKNQITLFSQPIAGIVDLPYLRFSKNKRLYFYGSNFVVYRLIQMLHFIGFSLQRNIIDSVNYDVVHYVFPYYADRLGTPKNAVFSCQDNNLRQSLLKNKFFVNGLRNNSFFDIASERLKSVLTKETGISDDFRLRVNPCSFIDYRKTFVGEKEPIIVFSGRMDGIKNPLTFVDVVQRVKSIRNDFRAIMLGNGPLIDNVMKQITEFDLSDVITVLFSNKPEEILSKSLIYLSIQNFDNYHSQALMEAMACGCAIVATDFGETYRLISDEVGFRVSLDVCAIAEKILWLLDHPDFAKDMGLRARKKVMSEQSIERFSHYIENLYADASNIN
jgi:glycosyltransferase involved in cell wall biosynthesis